MNNGATNRNQEAPGHLVEACSWDLTMGAAANVFGKLFLRSTSSSSDAMPEAIDHVGIILYNRLYEYGYRGILKSSIPRDGEDPLPQYLGCKLRKREVLGRTMKPRHEFVEWLVNAKYGKFRGSQYDMVNHNCLDFCKAVCEFLCVPCNPNWEKVSNWIKANQRLTDCIARGLGQPSTSSSSSSSSSNRERIQRRAISLQEQDNPPTIDEVNRNSSSSTNNGRPNGVGSQDSPRRRRRFSVASLMNRRGGGGGFRSASMETLPPTYEEALRMKDPVPRYEDLMVTTGGLNE